MSDERRGRREFVLDGVAYELVMDEDVRLRDIARDELTLVRRGEGEIVVFAAAAVVLPPLPGAAEIAEERKLGLRDVVERMLELGFDDDWVSSIAKFLGRHRLLRTRGDA